MAENQPGKAGGRGVTREPFLAAAGRDWSLGRTPLPKGIRALEVRDIEEER